MRQMEQETQTQNNQKIKYSGANITLYINNPKEKLS